MLKGLFERTNGDCTRSELLKIVKTISEFAHRITVDKRLICLPKLSVPMLLHEIEKEPASRV